MKYKPIQLYSEPESKTYQWKPNGLGGGLCLKDLEQNLLDDQSPRLLNMWYLNRILSKRYGQVWSFSSNLSGGKIISVYKKRYKNNIIFVCGTKMYSYSTAEESLWSTALWATGEWGGNTEIYSGLTDGVKGSFFEQGDYLYYKNQGGFYKYDGNTVTYVTPYIPVTFTATPPTGGGTALEEENRYGAGQTNRFSSTGGTTFQLSKTNLDATLCTAVVGGVDKTEITHFTVNRTTGLVTFGSAVTSGTNNVDITFYKTDSSVIDGFTACIHTINYGDVEETVFFGGNGKGDIFWSDVNLPNYIPLSNKKSLGSESEEVNGFGVQYGKLIIFKPRTIFSATRIEETVVSFAFAIVNNNIGCDMPYTIQLINNHLVFCNTYAGVHILLSTDTGLDNEHNVKPISDNINGTQFRLGLLAETVSDLQEASSCDWTANSQYWICVGTTVYMWDYGLRPYQDSLDTLANQKRLSWWKFDNINANCFFVDGSELYYGSRTVGNLSRFITPLNDFDSAINGIYRIPLRDFGITDWFKTVNPLTITSRADTNCKINIEYFNERDSRVEPQPIIVSSFSWSSFSWATFTWSVVNFGKSFTRYPNSKHVLYWGAEFSNNDVGRDLSIIDIIVLWTRSKKIR